MPNQLFKDFNLAMGRAIPLILQKNRLEFAQAEQDREFAAREAELMAEAQKAQDDIALKMYNAAVKDRFQEGAQAAGPAAERAAGFALPKKQLQGPPELGGSPELTQFIVPEKEVKDEPWKLDKTLWDLAGKDYKVFAKMKQTIKGEKADEEREFKSYKEIAIYHREKGNIEKANFYDKLAKSAKKESTAATPAERKRKQFEDDIQQDRGRLSSIEARQDIVSEALGSEQVTVVKRLKKSLFKKLTEYDKKYGKGASSGRFGVSAEDFEETDPLDIR